MKKKLKCYRLFNEDGEGFIIFAESYKQAKDIGWTIGYVADGHSDWRDYVSGLGYYRKLRRIRRYEPGEGAVVGEATQERYEKHGMYEL